MQAIINKFLSLDEDNLGPKGLIVLCVLAYLFGVICRSFYFFNALENYPYVFSNGFPMINTEDGYFFAEFVKMIAIDHPDASYAEFLFPNGRGVLIFLTWLLHAFLPFNIEQTAVLIPVIFAPLVAIPFIFIGRLLGNAWFGFCAGILCSVSNSFFRRTSFAYYDTDFFSVTAPGLIVLAGIYTLLNPSLRSTLIISLVLPLATWLDKAIVASPVYVTFCLIFVLMHFRHKDFFKMLIMLSVPLISDIDWYYFFAICPAVYWLLWMSQRHPISFIPQTTERRFWAVFSILFFIFTIWNHDMMNTIRFYISDYGTSGRGVFSTKSTSWSYYKVTGTIVEARTIDFRELAIATSGNMLLFLLSIFGAFLAIIRFPLLIIGAPLLGIGLFSLFGGIRFSLYLAPVISIGSAYLIMLIKRYININQGLLATPFVYLNKIVPQKLSEMASHNFLNVLKKYNPLNYLGWGVALALLSAMLYPGVSYAYKQPARAVAQISQINMLEELSEEGTFDDYIISWWDYGYVMRYYSNMRTIIDGGKHGNDNYIVSKAFSSTSQILAANLLREAVEAYAMRKEEEHLATGLLFGARRDNFQPSELVNAMARPSYVLKNPPERDIYLYIPYQMLRIYGVVRYFSDLNLATGEIRRVPFINSQHYRVDQQNHKIFMPGNIVVDLQNNNILRGEQVLGKINTFYQHAVVGDKTEMKAFKVNALGNYSVILSNYFNTLYIGSQDIINSNFIQMFFFRNYDRNYFELVTENPFSVIYKIRREKLQDLSQSQNN